MCNLKGEGAGVFSFTLPPFSILIFHFSLVGLTRFCLFLGVHAYGWLKLLLQKYISDWMRLDRGPDCLI